jgi:hypothetical protein
MLKAKLRAVIDAGEIVELHFDEMVIPPLERGEAPLTLEGVVSADLTTKELVISLAPVRRSPLEKLDA